MLPGEVRGVGGDDGELSKAPRRVRRKGEGGKEQEGRGQERMEETGYAEGSAGNWIVERSPAPASLSCPTVWGMQLVQKEEEGGREDDCGGLMVKTKQGELSLLGEAREEEESWLEDELSLVGWWETAEEVTGLGREDGML